MSLKLLSNILLRLVLLLSLVFPIAKPISREYYDNHYSKALLKIHTTDFNFFSDQLRTQLSYFLLMNDVVSLQHVLDSNFGLFGFVITDCTSRAAACDGEKILYSSNPDLDWREFPTVKDLRGSQYILLDDASPVIAGTTQAAAQNNIIGRLYVIANIPLSFNEDYSAWLRSPFKDIGPWKYYLKTMKFCLLGGLLVWMVVELLLRMRRIQIYNARQRELELIANADTYLNMLEEQNGKLEEQERSTTLQFETYMDRIRELELKVKNDIEYQKFTESVMHELEEAKKEQLTRLTNELSQTKFEMDILRNKIAALDSVSRKGGAAPSPSTAAYANAFEQKLFETLFRSSKYSRGDWRIINSFNVAAGRNQSQFTDCILISKDCLVVLEAKNYSGTIESEGDVENSKWFSVIGSEKREVQSLWGDNPFHQVNEYCMSLLRMIQKRSAWNIPVYGVIVFPEGTVLSEIGSSIGRFYRVATIDRLVAAVEIIDAEARRHNAFSKRPTPHQIEALIRGRAVANA